MVNVKNVVLIHDLKKMEEYVPLMSVIKLKLYRKMALVKNVKQL